MKKILFSLCLFSGFGAGAQDLALKIPKDADMVFSVKGDHFLDLMSAGDFDKSVLGKKMLKQLSERRKSGAYKSVADFGMRLSGTMYYYNKVTDSITYHCFLVPLSDVQKFEQLFKDRKPGSIEVRDDVKRIYSKGEGGLLQWNSEYAYLVMGNLNTHFIESDSAMSARYGIKEVSLSDYRYDRDEESNEGPEVVAMPVTTEGDRDYAVATPPPPPPVAMDEPSTTPAVVDEPGEEAGADKPYPPVADHIEDAVADTAAAYPIAVEALPVEAPDNYNYSYDNEAYQQAYETQRKVKKELTRQWSEKWLTSTAAITDIAQSVSGDKAYQERQDKDAAASFYLADVKHVMNRLMTAYYASPMLRGVYADGYGAMSGRLYLNEKEIRMVGDVEMDKEKAASVKKLYHHKLNSKFADYINMNKTVGFMAASVDMEAYLNAVPNLFKNGYYGRAMGLRGDELGMAAELFSLLLDEKAVAKVIKGDALFVVTNVGPKECNYTTYEYDENNYESKEVVKKKMETLPDFLLMMSSDDTHLLERLLAYGVQRNIVTINNGIYSLEGSTFKRSNPFGFHLLIKDGIVFCGTSLKDIRDISTGAFVGNISKEQRKMLLSSNMTVFFRPSNLAGKLTRAEFGNSRDLAHFNAFMENAGNMYLRSVGIKKNRVSTEFVAEVPEGNKNSLQYFLSLVDKTAQPGGSNEAEDED